MRYIEIRYKAGRALVDLGRSVDFIDADEGSLELEIVFTGDDSALCFQFKDAATLIEAYNKVTEAVKFPDA